MTTLDDLIARLEKATGPDRQLDADITRVVYLADMDRYGCAPVTSWFLHDDGESFGCETDGGRRYERAVRVLDYTSSIDAALTTVRDGLRIECIFFVLSVLVRLWDDAQPERNGSFLGDHESCPHAILIAVFKAIKARKMEDKTP